MMEAPRHTEATEIEVEVLEIDGEAPAGPSLSGAGKATMSFRPDDMRRGAAGQDWNHWRGRVQKLDMRWWPLWGIIGLVLGAIALALLLTVGLVVGALVLLLRLCAGVFRAVFR